MTNKHTIAASGPLLKRDAVNAFGSVLALAAALGVTRSAIYQWPDVVPEPRASHVREVARARGLVKERRRVAAQA